MPPCNRSTHSYRQPALIATSIFSSIGLPGNLLIIILFFRAKKKSTTTYLVLSLTIADIVNLLAIDILAAIVLLTDELRKKGLWLLLLTGPAKFVANFTFAAIALERYNALVKAMKPFVNITKKKILIGVILSWFTGISLSISISLHHSSHGKKQMTHSWRSYLLWATLLFLGYIIPLVIVLFCYSSILKGLYFDRTILGQKVLNEASLSEKKRLIRILVVITLVFLACNVPIILIKMLRYFIKCVGQGVFKKVELFLGCSSSFLNPFIYALQSEKYRNQVKELFCKKQESETVRSPPHVLDTKL